jgi:hypothetical protein
MVKIEDIKKELEKLKTDKDRINYLESLLESLKDKKLIQEIKNLIQTLQNLEVEIEGHSPEFDLRSSKIEAPKYEIKKPVVSERVSDLEEKIDNTEVKQGDGQVQYSEGPAILYKSGNGGSAVVNGIKRSLSGSGLLHGSTHQEIMEEKRKISEYLGNSPSEVTDRYFNAVENGETFKKYQSNIQAVDVNDILDESEDNKKYNLKKVEVK